MSYFTLLSREIHNGRLGPWRIQFGDFSLSTAQAEMNDYFEDDNCSFCMMKIIKTETEAQKEIDLVVEQLNGELK